MVWKNLLHLHSSRTLKPADHLHVQMDKEAIAKTSDRNLNENLVRRYFMIDLYHKPLMYLFSTTRPTSTMASAHVDIGGYIIYKSDNDTDIDVIVHRQ